MSVEILHVRSAADLDRLAAAWQEVQQSGGVSHPMYTWEWMSTWWEAFGEGRSLTVAIAEQGEQVAAVAPLVRRRARMNGPFVFRRMELMGTGEDEFEEVFSEYADLPTRPGTATPTTESLAGALLDLKGRHRWDDVILHRIRPDSAAYAAFERAARDRRLGLSVLSSGECPYVVLPSTLEDYESQLGKKRRYQIRRSIRDLERIGTISFERANTLDEALATLDLLEQLHQDRWQPKGRAGVFASGRFMDFQRTFIRRTFDLGWPELWTLRVGEEPIACRFNLRFGVKVACYISGMKLLEKKSIQPGILAHYFAIKDAIEHGAEEYDFLLGEQSYKVSMSNAARELATLRISRPCIKEALRRAAVCAARPLRRLRARRPEKRQS